MESTAIHTLYRINEGGLKTACVEFVQYGDADTMTVSVYSLKSSKGHSYMAAGCTERTCLQAARALWTSLRQAGYKTAREG